MAAFSQTAEPGQKEDGDVFREVLAALQRSELNQKELGAVEPRRSKEPTRSQRLLAGNRAAAVTLQMLEMVALGRPLLEVLNTLCTLLEEIATGCLCSILIVDAGQRRFRAGGGPSLPNTYHALLDGKAIDPKDDPWSLAVTLKAPVITADLSTDPHWASFNWPVLVAEHELRACWSIPILSGAGEALGVFALYRGQPVGPTAAEKELIERFTNVAGIAIERAERDQALRMSEAELRQAYGHLTQAQRLSHTGSFTTDVQADEHVWSDELYRILEIEPGTKVKFQTLSALVHQHDRSAFDASVERSLSNDADFDQIFRIVTPKGTTKHLHAVSQFVEGAATRIVMGSIQDITESKLAEAALRVSEAELREAYSYLTEAQSLSKTGSFTWDVFADEHTWSEEIRRIFDFDLEAKVTVTMILGAIYPDDMAEVERVIGGAVEGRDFDLTFRILTRSGALRHARVVGHRIKHILDRPVFLGALQDVTERKVAEEGLGRARSELARVARATALSAITASIAHELNQPLAGILTNASTCLRMLALHPPDIEGAQVTAQRTIRDGNRASEVLKRLRALFAGKPLGSEPVALNDAAREILLLSAAELQNGRVLLHSEFAGDLPMVVGDRVQLQQVILNLILNAAQAMQGIDGRPRDLQLVTERDGERVTLSVRDSGVGADTEDLEQLFNAFYTTKADGMGVGLSISRSIIEAHGGQLWASKNDGPGLTVSFSIPINGSPSTSGT